jgi:tetratricopeptide (TPR) repeat protein
MTSRLLTILMLLTPGFVWADPTLSEQAVSAYQRGLELQARDPDAARAQFRLAIDGYQSLLDEGHANAPLFCNLGHAYLLSGDTGRAVTFYRQAERLEPRNEQVQAGLAQVAGLLGKHAAPAVHWSDPNTPSRWLGPWPALVLGLIAFGLGGLGIVYCWWSRRRLPLVGAVPVMLCGLVLVGCVVWLGYQNTYSPAGVIAQACWLREGNGPSFRAVVDHELPAGVEFRILAERDGWLRVQLLNGVRGWLPAEAQVR